MRSPARRHGCAACTDAADLSSHNAHWTHLRLEFGPRTDPRLTAAITRCQPHNVTVGTCGHRSRPDASALALGPVSSGQLQTMAGPPRDTTAYIVGPVPDAAKGDGTRTTAQVWLLTAPRRSLIAAAISASGGEDGSSATYRLHAGRILPLCVEQPGRAPVGRPSATRVWSPALSSATD
jgi:hypothetical protein